MPSSAPSAYMARHPLVPASRRTTESARISRPIPLSPSDNPGDVTQFIPLPSNQRSSTEIMPHLGLGFVIHTHPTNHFTWKPSFHKHMNMNAIHENPISFTNMIMHDIMKCTCTDTNQQPSITNPIKFNQTTSFINPSDLCTPQTQSGKTNQQFKYSVMC